MNKVILHEPCGKCGGEFGIIDDTNIHKKLSCASCGRYIKFVGKHDVFEDANDIIDAGEKDGSLLDEINFKLDLILDHLGLRFKSDDRS